MYFVHSTTVHTCVLSYVSSCTATAKQHVVNVIEMAEDQSQIFAVASRFMPKACQTNWKLCFLCQIEKNEKLVWPADGKTSSATGYETIATNIVEFDKLGKIPLDIR